MAAPNVVLIARDTAAVPKDYLVPAAQEIEPIIVRADIDGSGAAGSFEPTLQVLSPAGDVIFSVPAATVAAGGSASVSWAPFLGSASGGGSSTKTYVVEMRILGDSQPLAVQSGLTYFTIPSQFDGLALTAVAAATPAAAGTGSSAFALHNVTQGTTLLTTDITIDANEFTSYTAAVPPVIDAANATVHTADILSVDIVTAGANALGLALVMVFSG